MAIVITTQPATNSINAAYRPLIIEAALNAVMPVAFCDVYINDVYYKTLSISKPGAIVQFDLQDAAHEYLKKFLAPNGGSGIQTALPVFATMYAKLRGSIIDADGFISIDAPIPIQATGRNPAVAGGGVQSNTFYMLNSTLQHEDNQSLALHLTTYKTRTWNAAAWPLSHRKDGYRVSGSDYFPIVYTGANILSSIKIYYTMRDGTTGNLTNGAVYPACGLITAITIGEVNNGDGTQTLTFNWTAPGDITSVDIMYRANGTADPFTSVNGSTATGRILVLPLGLLEIKFRGNGPGCNSTTTGVSAGEGIAAGACVPIAITGAPDLPNAFVGEAYSYVINLTGDMPHTLGAVTKPGWMTVAIVGGNIHIEGTPAVGDIGAAVAVSIHVDNACGGVTFADTLNITDQRTQFVATDFISSDALNTLERANIQGPVGASVTVTLNLLTNTNGGVFRVNTALAYQGNTWVIVLNGAGHGEFNAEINGVTNPNTVIRGRFIITAVSIGSIGDNNIYQISKIFT